MVVFHPIPTGTRFINLTGRKFGRLTALGFAGNRKWVCQCECGTQKAINSQALKSGETRSCGCLQKELAAKRLTKHGYTSRKGCTPTYQSWACMIQRCTNPNLRCYHRYGGRGIKVCERWRDSFKAFLSDMGKRPSKAHEIDRKDNDGNYEPGNCQWTTHRQNMSHTRRTRLITIAGRTQTMADWSRETGVDSATICTRLARGRTPEEALGLT